MGSAVSGTRSSVGNVCVYASIEHLQHHACLDCVAGLSFQVSRNVCLICWIIFFPSYPSGKEPNGWKLDSWIASFAAANSFQLLTVASCCRLSSVPLKGTSPSSLLPLHLDANSFLGAEGCIASTLGVEIEMITQDATWKSKMHSGAAIVSSASLQRQRAIWLHRKAKNSGLNAKNVWNVSPCRLKWQLTTIR